MMVRLGAWLRQTWGAGDALEVDGQRLLSTLKISLKANSTLNISKTINSRLIVHGQN